MIRPILVTVAGGNIPVLRVIEERCRQTALVIAAVKTDGGESGSAEINRVKQSSELLSRGRKQKTGLSKRP